MSRTLSELLTSLAYRLGEDSSPTDASEKARRISFINEGYRKLIGTYPAWFQQSSATFNSVANQQAYSTAGGFPTNFRDMIEVRVDDEVYEGISPSEVFSLYDTDDFDNIGNKYYMYQGSLNILPAPTDNGTNNIAIKYYAYPTAVSSDSDTFVIPDFYLDALVAYAYARISYLDGKRGDSADAFNEFNEIVGDLMMESNRQKFYGKDIATMNPSIFEDAD